MGTALSNLAWSLVQHVNRDRPHPIVGKTYKKFSDMKITNYRIVKINELEIPIQHGYERGRLNLSLKIDLPTMINIEDILFHTDHSIIEKRMENAKIIDCTYD